MDGRRELPPGCDWKRFLCSTFQAKLVRPPQCTPKCKLNFSRARRLMFPLFEYYIYRQIDMLCEWIWGLAYAHALIETFHEGKIDCWWNLFGWQLNGCNLLMWFLLRRLKVHSFVYSSHLNQQINKLFSNHARLISSFRYFACSCVSAENKFHLLKECST